MNCHPVLLLAAILLASSAQAAVYKCRDKSNAVVYSQEPCEKDGAREEKKLTRQELKANEVRMRPQTTNGGSGKADYSQGSNYQGSAPDRTPQNNRNRD